MPLKRFKKALNKKNNPFPPLLKLNSIIPLYIKPFLKLKNHINPAFIDLSLNSNPPSINNAKNNAEYNAAKDDFNKDNPFINKLNYIKSKIANRAYLPIYPSIK
jgi:hypothetical protein